MIVVSKKRLAEQRAWASAWALAGEGSQEWFIDLEGSLAELMQWREWAKGCGQMEDTGAPRPGGAEYYEMWHPCERLSDAPKPEGE